MRLGLQLGYDDPVSAVALAEEAERLGFDSVWTSEAWGADAVTPLAWIAARTERIGLGTAIMQMPARTPAATAMTVATLDHLSGGRVRLGLGTSGPQVVGGLARPAVGQTAREDARVRRDRAHRAAPRDRRAPRRPLRHPVRRRRRNRPRQAAEDDPAAAAQGGADLPRRNRPAQRRARSGDRRRLAADLLLARAVRRGARAEPRRRLRVARRQARRVRRRAARPGRARRTIARRRATS